MNKKIKGILMVMIITISTIMQQYPLTVLATDANENEICSHHIHDEECGYTDTTSCHYDIENCVLCNQKNIENETKEKEVTTTEENNCICEEKCSKEQILEDCKGCHTENSVSTICEGKSVTGKNKVLKAVSNEVELNIANGSIIIAANGVTQNGMLIADSQGKTYVITGTGADNDKLEINASATIVLKNVSMQTKQTPNVNYDKDLNPISVNAQGVTLLLEGNNTLTTDHYYNAAINVKANAELNIDSALTSGSLNGTLKAVTTKSNDEIHNASNDERYPGVAIGDNGGTAGNRGAPYSNNIVRARSAFVLNIKGGTFDIGGYPTVFGNRQKIFSGDASAVLATVNVSGGYVLGSGTMVDPFNSAHLIAGKQVNASFSKKPEYKGTIYAEKMQTMANVDLNGSFVLGDNSGPVSLTNVDLVDEKDTRSYSIMIGSGSPVTFNQCHFKIGTINSKSDVTFTDSIVDTTDSIRLDNNRLTTDSDSAPLDLLIEGSTIVTKPTYGVVGIATIGINTTQYAGGNITVKNSDIKVILAATGSPSMARYAIKADGNINIEDSNLELSVEAANYKATRASIFATKDGNANGGSIDISHSNISSAIHNIATDGQGSAYSMFARDKANITGTKLEGNGLYYGTNELGYKNSFVINSSSSSMSYSEKTLTVDESYIYTPLGYLKGTESLKIKNNSYIDTRYLKDVTASSSIENSVVMSRMQLNTVTNSFEPLNEGYTYGKAILQFDPAKLANIEIPEEMTLFVEKSKAGELCLANEQVLLVKGNIKNQNNIVIDEQAKLITNNLVQNEGIVSISSNATLELQDQGVIKNFQTGKVENLGTLTNNGKILNSVLFKVTKNNTSWNDFENRWIGISDGNTTFLYEEEVDYNGVSQGQVIYAPQGNYFVSHSKKIMQTAATDHTVLTSIQLSSDLSSLQVIADFYEVIFDKNDNSREAIETRILLNGSHYSDYPTLTKSGYTFGGWNTKADGTGMKIDSEAPLVLSGKTTWYAQWISNQYTVKFETAGGSLIVDQIVEDGNKAVKPVEPIKTGYTFKGWYIDKEYTIKYNFDQNVTNDLVIYAQWNKATIPDIDEPEQPEQPEKPGDSGNTNKPGEETSKTEVATGDVSSFVWYGGTSILSFILCIVLMKKKTKE